MYKQYNTKKDEVAICKKCAEKEHLVGFLLSVQIPVGECVKCGVKFGLANYAILKALNKFD